MTDWIPEYPDWSKEKRCTECRSPAAKFKGSGLSYTPVTCRACKHIKITLCEDCKEEMGFCTYRDYNPPNKDIDKKRKCVLYEQI
jgi:hypothetical protein